MPRSVDAQLATAMYDACIYSSVGAGQPHESLDQLICETFS